MDRDHQVMAAFVVAVIFGVNGVALARFVFWRRWPALFWLIFTFIVLVVAYLIGTGASENIAQSLWPRIFDPIQRKEFGLRAACETPRMLGLWLIFMPLLLSVLLYKIYRFGLAGALQSHRLRDAIVLGVCFVLLYVSPIPEKLARMAFPEEMLQVPSHCTSIRSRRGSTSRDLARRVEGISRYAIPCSQVCGGTRGEHQSPLDPSKVQVGMAKHERKI